MDKKVLVSGIGGNVGQGIIRNINKVFPNVIIVGVDINDFSSGNHLCDIFYKVPYANDSRYIESINEIVKKEQVNLIIPSTDYEVFYLSKYQHLIKCTIAVSEFKTADFCTDKMKTYEHFRDHNMSFAPSTLPSKYVSNQFDKLIVKPIEGRGSRDIYINPKNISAFSDKFLVQKLYEGIEVTIAFYVNKVNILHGFITQERTLESGTTKNTKVTKAYDALVEPLLNKLIKSANFSGSINLQAIITKENTIHPFEVNCRISGTNSMRSNFGFEDIKYTLQEYLFNDKLSKVRIREGIATRIIMDVIYTEAKDYNEATNKKSTHFIF